MKILPISAIAGIAFAGNALAADSLRIESEAQFVRDYGDLIEHVGPGVYQLVEGPLAGKTVALGEPGLIYDLAALRAQTPKSLRERAQIKTRIKQLEGIRARFATLRERQARDLVKKSASGSFPCNYYDWRNNRTIWYSGYAQVSATTELFLDNGGGGLNWYYARASATASGTVFRPLGVPPSLTMTAYAFAKNHYTGEAIERIAGGVTSTGVTTGYVYSGPEFSHNLTATATLSGSGHCFGYVSISDAMQ
jgi:hypothetical protein